MSIKKHLPKPMGRKLIQARIDKSIYEKLRMKLNGEGINIKDFFEAAARSYLEEK